MHLMKKTHNTPSLRTLPALEPEERTGKELILFCEDQIRDYLYACDCGYCKYQDQKKVLAGLRKDLAAAEVMFEKMLKKSTSMA